MYRPNEKIGEAQGKSTNSGEETSERRENGEGAGQRKGEDPNKSLVLTAREHDFLGGTKTESDGESQIWVCELQAVQKSLCPGRQTSTSRALEPALEKAANLEGTEHEKGIHLETAGKKKMRFSVHFCEVHPAFSR